MSKPRTKPDRRVARTELSLHRALNSLVLEKGYRKTTVQDILARANIGRSTFYAHHGSKEGLLLHGLHHLQDALRQSARDTDAAGRETAPTLGFSATFFAHVHEYRDTFQALRKGESGPLVLAKIKRGLLEVIRTDLGRAKPARPTVPREAAVRVTAETLFTILLWWLDHRPELSPVQADEVFRRLALPALAANGFANPAKDVRAASAGHC